MVVSILNRYELVPALFWIWKGAGRIGGGFEQGGTVDCQVAGSGGGDAGFADGYSGGRASAEAEGAGRCSVDQRAEEAGVRLTGS